MFIQRVLYFLPSKPDKNTFLIGVAPKFQNSFLNYFLFSINITLESGNTITAAVKNERVNHDCLCAKIAERSFVSNPDMLVNNISLDHSVDLPKFKSGIVAFLIN